MAIRNLFTLFIFFFIVAASKAQDLSVKANNFLKTLSADLKMETQFSMNSAERLNFNYVPMSRKGPTFHHFNEKQKAAAIDLLKASISKEGYRKSSEIIELENVLANIENNPLIADGSPYRDPLNYHFSIFGKPSPDEFWGWRFEGHHISLNFSSNKGKIVSSTPSFFGSNPGIVKDGPQRGKEVLKKETDLGFSLIRSFSAEQLKTARFSDKAPGDIISSNSRKVDNIELKGIPYTSLTESQKQLFKELLNVYIDNYEFDFAKSLREKINTAGFDNLYFGWAGGLQAGEGNYYRIQGPMLLIEYDNVQNNANHVHTVVRDLTNDFAADILREHYRSEHKKQL